MTPALPCTRGAPRRLVVAGISVRALAESARQGGWEVIALDLYGDADTRRASVRWTRIGEPAGLRIDPARLRRALQQAARVPGVEGWVPASGFEDAPGLLEAGGPALPCLAIASDALRRVRDPRAFFATLDRHGVPHPPVAFDAPADPDGWLAKRAGGCGGLHVRPARQALADPAGRPADTYFQRWQAGTPMSALFLADGARWQVVALNRLLVRPIWPLDHVYAGALGPVPDPGVGPAVDRALSVLVPEFRLCGLASLDFIGDGARASFLEVNPRPPATLQLHADAWPGGLLRAHVDAVRGRLPAAAPSRGRGVRGHLTVFADRPGLVGAPSLHDPAVRPHVHDVPAPGTRFAVGEPICSVSAQAGDVDDALRLLQTRAARIRRALAPHPAVAAEELSA